MTAGLVLSVAAASCNRSEEESGGGPAQHIGCTCTSGAKGHEVCEASDSARCLCVCPEDLERERIESEALLARARQVHPASPDVLCARMRSVFASEGRELPFTDAACESSIANWRRERLGKGLGTAAELQVELHSRCLFDADSIARLDECARQMDESATEEAPEVPAGELVDAYAANELAADQKYSGHKIIVTGVVDRVVRGMGEVHIIIRPQGRARHRIDRVQFKVLPEHLADAAEARPGDPIRAGGCVTGNMMGQVFVEPCDD